MAMQQLNLPSQSFRIREHENKKEIFDTIRHKFVALTPEEWVRQHFIHFLIDVLKVPPIMLAIEKSLRLHTMTKRTDILVYGSSGKPLMIVECKAPEIKINQSVFEQIGRYNLALQVRYLMVSNGLEHFCARIDFEEGSYTFLEKIPMYEDLKL